MKLNIPLTELSSLIKAKAHKDIQLRQISERTLSIGYVINVKVPIIGTINKTIEIRITVKSIVGDDLHLSYDAGASGDLIIKGLVKLIPQEKFSSTIDFKENSIVILHLGKIEKLQEPLKYIQINDISFNEEEAKIDFSLKGI